jgi:cobyric acid synthase CobQ/L-threonine-O-3-phosphate decarboxylase
MTRGHGGNLRDLARLAGRPSEEVLDFSASINPLGPPDCLRPVLSRAIDLLVHYPDPESRELVAALARSHGVEENRIIVGNGSTELLFAIMRARPRRRAVIPAPCYIDYSVAARRAGIEVHSLALEENAGFALDWDALEQSLGQDDLVILGQPNNPTGVTFDPEKLRHFAACHADALFVIDEAFADFIEDYRPLLRDVPANVVVMRSMTKFYALAGLRLGFAVARPEMAALIRAQMPPWSVNTLAQAAGGAVLADEDYARRSRALVTEQREALTAGLRKLPGLYVYPSSTNFLLVRLNRSDLDAPALAARLIVQGIAIRVCDNFEGLDRRFFRLAVRTGEENERLLAALAEALGLPNSATSRKRRTPALMFQGTSSDAGKSVLTAALCRILLQDGLRVAPFKSQNMSNNSAVTASGGEIGRAQALQAQACRLEPDVRMNPILLKPNSDTGSQVIVRGRAVGNMDVAAYVRYKPQAFAAAKECYDSLAAECDAVVLEGAGSPGEVNLKSHDIANMQMARYAGAPVVIVGDIDRGGVFASFVGTMEVLAQWERQLVAGWVVNRFRGDAGLLGPALDYTLAHTGRPVLGVVPYLADLNLPQEDSVRFKSGAMDDRKDGAELELAVIDLPHISNFTDFDALAVESDARIRIVRRLEDLGHPDAIIFPGSKNTLADLEYLKRSGLARRVGEIAAADGAEIVGICGGFQMLGRTIRDPQGIESATGRDDGLGLLAVETVLAADKTLTRTQARYEPTGLKVFGYEIHHGLTTTDGPDLRPIFIGDDGRVAGVSSGNGRVWGTYLHGVFDADGFRRAFLDRLRTRRGLAALGSAGARYEIEPALDRLADVVRQCLDMKQIYRMMGL